ncbi:ACP phosphodiesterase [Balneatrix alpica]|uniref:acyl carrier protein phosphodiesterase n=1 Tax=Balneatrix alpica TaxID=75684 RepID=UPI0027399C6A|nr:ACP phosphodiesterase [Balneatrix alpica]
MNFLAHLHIADHCQSSLLGNLLGDFIKGDPHSQLMPDLAAGVRLHRFVDSYSDHHPLTQTAKQVFSGSVRRFAPIALDMFWDHCLAKRWQEFHPLPLARFCQQAEHQIRQQQQGDIPSRYLQMEKYMWRERWLESYRQLDNIELALQRISQRRARMEELSRCFPYLVKGYEELNGLFTELYPEVLSAAQAKVQQDQAGIDQPG